MLTVEKDSSKAGRRQCCTWTELSRERHSGHRRQLLRVALGEGVVPFDPLAVEHGLVRTLVLE